MSSLVMNIRGAMVNPARRRFWLTMVSGGLIAVGLVARYGFEMVDLWLPLMVAAALLAGSDIAVRAWRALQVRHLSIELLVTVAAVGALVIGEVWEAAAVTFLFMFGAWLEMRTMGQTRGALKALLDAAPATATVLLFSPIRMIAVPTTTSAPLWLALPVRNSFPISTVPMSRTRIGVPSREPTTTRAMASRAPIRPSARTT